MRRLGTYAALLVLLFLLNAAPKVFDDLETALRRPPAVSAAAPPARKAPPAPAAPVDGERLAEPSPRDPAYVIEPAGPKTDSTGTAFPVRAPGWFMTARHVVEGCDRVGIVSPRGGVDPVTLIALDSRADLALMRYANASAPLATGGSGLRYGQSGYAFGYPRGIYGQVHGVLLGRVRERSGRRRGGSVPMIMWSVVDAYPESIDSLSGMSGGPMLDAGGRVVGVNSSASPRRGRLATVAPRAMDAMLAENSLRPPAGPAPALPGLDARHYPRAGERLRRSGRVVHVLCDVRGHDGIRGWR